MFISSVQDYASILIYTIALYQSFLALYKIKDNAISISYWSKKFKLAGYLFLFATFLNLIKTSVTGNKTNILTFFKSEHFVIGVTPGILILILTTFFFFYLSSIKQMKNKYE